MSWLHIALLFGLNVLVYSHIYNDHEYLGCFADSVNDRDIVGLNSVQESRWDCITTCKAQGFSYSGNQYGDECYCGNSYGKHGQTDESDCNMQCTALGNTQTCGAYYRNTIYDTGFRMEEDRVSADVGKLSSGATVECSSGPNCNNTIDGEAVHSGDSMWTAEQSDNNVGEWVKVTLARPYWVKEVSMIQNRQSILTQARQIKIDFSDGSTKKMYMHEMPLDEHNWEGLRLDPPVLTDWVKVTFLEAFLKTEEAFGIVELDIIADFGPLSNQAALRGTATSSTQYNSNYVAQYSIDGTLKMFLAFLINTWIDQWVHITLDAEHWVHVIKYANRCHKFSQHRSVLMQIYGGSSDLLWESLISSQVLMFNEVWNGCRSFRWTTVPLQETRLLRSVKFTIKDMWFVEGTHEIATGMGEIQIFTGQNFVGSGAPVVEETFPVEKRPLLRGLTDMNKATCLVDVQDFSGGKMLFYTNAAGLTQFRLVITTNGGAAGDFDVFSTGNTTMEITSARMQRCVGPELPGTGEFMWTCTTNEAESSLYAALILVSTSSVYQICEIEILAGSINSG